MPNTKKVLGTLFPKSHWFWQLWSFIFIYTCAVCWFDDHYFPIKKYQEANEVISVTGVVIGLLLAFRTNSAYDRWWEGRKLWGQLVNDLRNLALKLKVYLEADADRQFEVGQLLVAFPYALKSHLRGKEPDDWLIKLDPEAAKVDHVPLHMSGTIYHSIFRVGEASGADVFELILVDSHVRSLMDICGACERILKSPIANSYKSLIWIWLILYLLVLPWLLVPSFDLWTIPLMFLGTYFVIALEFLAEEVEEPFGEDPNDLPLDSICETIERSVCQTFGCSSPRPATASQDSSR